MKDNTWGWVALLVASFYVMKGDDDKGENMFFVPGVGEVPESALPGLGYVKFNGRWFSQADIAAAAAANGVTTSGNIDIETQTGLDIFLTLLNAGAAIVTTVITNNAAIKADLIEEIMTKYTLLISPNYTPTFPYTETQLNGFTIANLRLILAGNLTIQGIKADANTQYSVRCQNGQYTDSKGRGACSWNGGVRSRAGWAQNL